MHAHGALAGAGQDLSVGALSGMSQLRLAVRAGEKRSLSRQPNDASSSHYARDFTLQGFTT